MKTITLSLPLAIMLFTMTICLKSQTSFIWGKQFGTDKEEYVMNHVIDQNENIYVSGKTSGTFNDKNLGKTDGFICKIDKLGNKIWARQFGSNEEEDIQWSDIDQSGNIYITGSTKGIINGKSYGREDVFIVKYDSNGQLVWSEQFGTDSTDIGTGIYIDHKGFIYITGFTNGKLGKSSFGKSDGFLMKLDEDGHILFINQFGTTNDDISNSITGNHNSAIYVCGSTWGDLAAKNKGFLDIFTGEFTNNGNLVRYNQFGSEGFDIAMTIKADMHGNVFVGGSTSGNFGCQQIGEGDCFLIKTDEKGNLLWNKQFGTSRHDGIRDIECSEHLAGNIMVSGVLSLPPAQAFIRMFKTNSDSIWEKNFTVEGHNGDSSGKDINVSKNGTIYHAGLSSSNLFGILNGVNDFYLVKLKME